MNNYKATYQIKEVRSPGYEDVLAGATGSPSNWEKIVVYQFEAKDNKRARIYSLNYAKTLKERIGVSFAKLIDLEKIVKVSLK